MKIKRIFIDQGVPDADPVVNKICTKLGLSPVRLGNPVKLYQMISKADDPEKAGKSVLLLTRNKGAFIRDCPGTSHYTCCNYKILHIGTYCPMDCAYCILQAYFHPPMMQFFVNHEDMDQSLAQLFSERIIRRIGTGEYTDSLIWEGLYPIAANLIDRFSGQACAVLELKTKTAHVDSLIGRTHHRKTIMAWSLNTESIIAGEERFTASLGARIKAAEKCQAAGYPLAFHFDPLVIYDDCRKDYTAVIDRLFDRIDPDNIVWISMGTFRFMPDLKPIVARRFRGSKIVYGEFIKAMDGKMRYFKPLRIRLYQQLIAYIRRKAPHVTIYFCMEDDEVWNKALGFIPSERGGLPRMLDEQAASHCGLAGEFQSR